MAGFLSLFNTPERLPVAEGFWIDIKKSLTTEDYEAAQRTLLGKMSMVAGEGIRSNPDTISYQQELVFRAIVDWNLTDENEALLPLSPEVNKRASIKKLPQEIFLDIYQKVSVSSAPRDSDAERNFRSGGEVGTGGRDGEASDPAEVSD